MQLTVEGFLRVVTVVAVAEGEPLTLSYLPLPIALGGLAQRHADLKAAFFFDCDCGLCDDA